jgi:hypothetical protein
VSKRLTRVHELLTSHGRDRGPLRLEWTKVHRERRDLLPDNLFKRWHGYGAPLFTGGFIVASGTCWILVLAGGAPAIHD